MGPAASRQPPLPASPDDAFLDNLSGRARRDGAMSAALKTLVSQATRDSDTPPSGYQLDQLTKASFASPVDADLLQDAVVRRLDSKSANVKWKTLRVIAYLCTNGNPSMRKSFQRRTDILRAAAGFTGPLHPLHGDAPNERVRCAAKEAMNSLFASTDAEPPQHHKSSIASQHFSGMPHCSRLPTAS